MQLERPDQLPELPGDLVAIEWACVDTPDGKHWQVLRHNDAEIWREKAWYESYPRFEQIFDILLERHGTRFVRLQPTDDSLWWLYGDSLSAGSRID